MRISLLLFVLSILVTNHFVNGKLSSNVCSSGLTLLLVPASDTYTDQARPNTMFGHESTLSLFTSNLQGQGKISFLKFYIPTGLNPTYAVLSMYGALEDDNLQSASVSVSLAGSNLWNEDSMSYSTQIPTCQDCESTSTNINNTVGWYQWNVLSYLTQEISLGKSVVSFFISIDSGHAWFDSSDAPSYQPAITLYFD